MPKVSVIIGFGLGAGEALLDRFLHAGYDVAIVSRTQSKLDTVAARYVSNGHNVKGYACDLSKPEDVPALLERIAAEMGPINVAIYNATIAVVSYTAPLAEIEAAVATNITSLHVAFNHLLPRWQESGGGTFLLSGGGLAANGAYSVGFNFQFGAAAKSYFKNFAESALATFASSGIHVTCMTISGLTYGGDNVRGDHDAEANAQWKIKLGDAYVQTAELPASLWVPDVVIAP